MNVTSLTYCGRNSKEQGGGDCSGEQLVVDGERSPRYCSKYRLENYLLYPDTDTDTDTYANTDTNTDTKYFYFN